MRFQSGRSRLEYKREALTLTRYRPVVPSQLLVDILRRTIGDAYDDVGGIGLEATIIEFAARDDGEEGRSALRRRYRNRGMSGWAFPR